MLQVAPRIIRMTATFLALLFIASPHALATNVTVIIDEARVVRLQEPATTVVVGNPSIADVMVRDGKLLIVTGKTFGHTNLIALDAEGREILHTDLSVQKSPRRVVTMHKGPARYSFECAPHCQPVLTVGDSGPWVEELSKQIMNKFQTSMAGGAKK